MRKAVMLALVLVLISGVFAKPVSIHNTFTIPGVSSIAPDLVAQLRDAKVSGDATRVAEIQARIDEIAGVVHQPPLSCSSEVVPLDYIPPRSDGKSFGSDGYVVGAPYYEGQPAVAVSSDGTIFCAFVAADTTEPHKVVAVVKSTDGGTTWVPLIKVRDPDGDLHYPDIAVGEGDQNWVFVSFHTSGNDVQVARFSFSGADGEVHSVDGSAFTSKYKARITVDEGPHYYVYLAYITSNIFDTDVHFARSTDFGVSWSPMDFTSTGTDYCDIAYLGGGRLAIVTQTTSGETGALWCAVSSDYGASWHGSNIASSGFLPRIAAHDGKAMVVYTYRFSESDHDIKYVLSTDGGSTWSDGFVDALYYNEKYPDITAGENAFMTAYWEQGKIKFSSFPYGGTGWIGTTNVSDEATATETFPAIAVVDEAPGGCPFVVWEETFSSDDHDIRFDKNCCSELSANLYAFPTEGTAPLDVTFKNQSTGSVDNFVIYFGDGDSSTADSVVHTYAEPGTYTAMLVASNFCHTETVTVEINVGCPEPVAGIWASPSMGTAPLTVYFTDTSTGYIVTRRWDFGDGTTDTAAITSHTFTSEGMYNVSLVVYDPCGNSDTAFASIWVYSPTGAQLSVSPDPMDFGEVPVGECANAHLILSNVGDDTLRIDSIKVEGDYAVTFPGTMFLPPDGTDSVEVRFCPTDTGEIAGRITIFSNDSHSPIKSVMLSGVGTASPMMNLTVTPEVLLFDSVATDECQTKRITVRNNGDTPIAITALTLVGSGAFTIVGHDTFTVDPGSYRYITIRFCPFSSVASYSGTLFVQTEVGEYTVILLGNVYEELTCVDYGTYQICSNHIDGSRVYGNIRLVNDHGDTVALIGSAGDIGAYIDLSIGAGTGLARFVHEDGSMPYVYGGAFDLTSTGIRFRFDPSTSMLPDSIRDRITPDSLLGAPFSYTASIDPAIINVDEGYWEIGGEISVNNGPNFIGGIGVHRRSYYDGEVQWFVDDFQIGLWDNAFQFKFRDVYVSHDTIEAGRIFLKVNSSLIPSSSFIDGGYFQIDARSLAIYHGELVNLDLDITFPDFVFPAGGHTVGIRRARMRLVWEDGMITRFSGGGRLSISGLMPDLGGETYIGAYVTIIRDVGMDDVRLEFMGWSPGIPLGTTGFFLTGVFGEVDHITDPDNLFIQFGCQLSGGPSVPYFGSVVRMEPEVTIDFAHDMFALEGTVRFLEHLARGSGGFRYWWNYGGGGWALTGYANLRAGITDHIWAQGGTELSMWREPAGRFHLSGNTSAEVHINHHAIAWLFPTHDIEVSGALYYGEFRHGGDSGGHWGVKGEAYLNFFGMHPTFAYIDGHLSLMGDARSYTPMEMYRRFYKSKVEEDLAYNIGNTDMNLFIVRTADDITPNISVETPDGHLITLDSCSFDQDAELVRVEGYYDGHFYRGIMVKRNIPGIWTVHLSDIPAGDSDHPVQVKGFYRPMEIALSTTTNPYGFQITGGVDGAISDDDTIYLTIMLKPLDIQAGPEPIAELALSGDYTVDQTFSFDDLGFVEGDYIVMAYAEDRYNRFAQFVDSTAVIHFPEDHTPPSAPEFAIASWVDDENIRLVWKRVNEPDVAGYKVYKGWANGDGTYDWWEANDVAGANYFLFDNAKVMIPESLRTSFVFGISAYDNSGNEGETLIVVPSGVDPADRDTIPPTVAFDYATPNLAERTLDIGWHGDGGIYEYLLTVANIDGYVFLQTELEGDITNYTVDKLMPGADYMLIIAAVDSALNLSAPETLYVPFYEVADQDGDGLPDWWEEFFFDSPNNCNPADDPDGDLVSNRDEYAAGTDPNNIDSDNDGVSDLSELASPLLDPNSAADENGNRIADDWEIYFFGSDTISGLAEQDPDHDGLTNLEEYENHTDPHSYDTDGGGLPDGDEVALGTDPRDSSDDNNVVWTITLRRGWNMISLPVEPAVVDWEQLFPTALAVFEYDNATGAYYPVDELEPGKGYWVYSTEDVDVAVAGSPVFTIHTDFVRGWLMIGAPMYPDGYPTTAINTVPDGLLIPPAFTYDGTGYVETASLEPGKGYWIFVNGDGSLTMDRAFAALGRTFATGDYAAGAPPAPPSLGGDNVVLPDKLVAKVAPTPFNSSTNISVALSEDSYVNIAVFDVNGHLLRTLYDGDLAAGFHNFVWDATDNSSAQMPTGIYFVKVRTPERVIVSKAVLVR